MAVCGKSLHSSITRTHKLRHSQTHSHSQIHSHIHKYTRTFTNHIHIPALASPLTYSQIHSYSHKCTLKHAHVQTHTHSHTSYLRYHHKHREQITTLKGCSTSINAIIHTHMRRNQCLYRFLIIHTRIQTCFY